MGRCPAHPSRRAFSKEKMPLRRSSLSLKRGEPQTCAVRTEARPPVSRFPRTCGGVIPCTLPFLVATPPLAPGHPDPPVQQGRGQVHLVTEAGSGVSYQPPNAGPGPRGVGKHVDLGRCHLGVLGGQVVANTPRDGERNGVRAPIKARPHARRPPHREGHAPLLFKPL